MFDIIEERFIASNAAIKTILEVLIGTGTVAPHAVGRLFRGQSRECLDRGEALAGHYYWASRSLQKIQTELPDDVF